MKHPTVMPSITITGPVGNSQFDPKDHVRRYLSRAMPAVRQTFLNPDCTLRSGTTVRTDKKAGTVTVTIGIANAG